MLQHIATLWPNAFNMLRPTMLYMLSWHVMIVCPGLNKHSSLDLRQNMVGYLSLDVICTLELRFRKTVLVLEQ